MTDLMQAANNLSVALLCIGKIEEVCQIVCAYKVSPNDTLSRAFNG